MRDPRVDPKPGDVLLWGALHPLNMNPDRGGLRVYVDALGSDGKIIYACGRLGYECSLKEWRKDMAEAEVLNVAAD